MNLSSIIGIRFAPIKIPLKRRLETLAVLYYVLQFFLIGQSVAILLIYLLFTKYYYITLLYISYFLYDYKTSFTGGRRWHWFRKLKLWKHYSDYFPIKLIKTAELPNDRNYIFGLHPHGILCCSHFANFATEATGFSEKFPGIIPHLITLNFQFYLPVQRDVILLNGTCPASKESIQYIISKKGPGNSAAIVIGGAREAAFTCPGTMNLTLKKRKGFVKLALQNGTSLVPVISFGENDLFNTLDQKNMSNNFYVKLQNHIIRIFTFSLPYFVGRGVFQYSLGLLPFRKPVNTIIGKPIHLEKNPNPTQEQIDTIHQRYIDELTELFEKNKDQYYPQGKITLNIE